MRNDARRQRQPRSQQKGRPVNAMEADDLLANHVHAGPIPLVERALGGLGRTEAESGDVVAQRVQPDVDDVRGIARHGNAPCEGGARNRKIA